MKKSIDYYLGLEYPIVITSFVSEHFSGYRGYLVDVPEVESLGKSKEEVLKDIEDVKKEWFQHLMNKGKKIPEPDTRFTEPDLGQTRMTLRLQKTLAKKVILFAKSEGTTMNQCLNTLIQDGLYQNELKSVSSELTKIKRMIQ